MKLELKGQRFGRLTVIEYAGSKNYKTLWLCKCDCGKEKVVKGQDLKRGSTRSCGCLRDEAVKNQKQMYPVDVRIKRLRHIWHGMMRRCNDPGQKYYHRYGGRGISVCDEWKDYVVFARWAINNGYSDELKIDRIDNNGNYEPGNCRWVTEKQQHNNTSRCRFVTINGEKKTITEWAEENGIDPNTVFTRLGKGMNLDEALTKPTHRNGGHGIPIRCVETGEEFPSITVAAKEYHANISCIAEAARTGRTSCGKHWEHIYKR